MSETAVECDRWGKRVRLRKDDTVALHVYGRAKKRCEQSGKLYARHMGSFRKSQTTNRWIAECRCGEFWTGDDYQTVDRAWSEHVGVEPKFPEQLQDVGGVAS